jgi:type IV secretion system protein TrbL
MRLAFGINPIRSRLSYRHAAVQSLKEGDRGGASATPDIKDKDD